PEGEAGARRRAAGADGAPRAAAGSLRRGDAGRADLRVSDPPLGLLLPGCARRSTAERGPPRAAGWPLLRGAGWLPLFGRQGAPGERRSRLLAHGEPDPRAAVVDGGAAGGAAPP